MKYSKSDTLIKLSQSLVKVLFGKLNGHSRRENFVVIALNEASEYFGFSWKTDKELKDFQTLTERGSFLRLAELVGVDSADFECNCSPFALGHGCWEDRFSRISLAVISLVLWHINCLLYTSEAETVRMHE